MSPHPRAKGSQSPKRMANTSSFGLCAASISGVDEPWPIPFGSTPLRRHARTQSALPQQTDVIKSSIVLNPAPNYLGPFLFFLAAFAGSSLNACTTT